MTHAEAVAWAASLGDGARLPTRFESALLYTNLRDRMDTEKVHWTGTQYSADDAWYQDFGNGNQASSTRAPSSVFEPSADCPFDTLTLRD